MANANTDTVPTVDCYALGVISVAYFLLLQDLFRSVRSEMGGLALPPKAAEHLYRRGLIDFDRDWKGRPARNDRWVPSAKAEAGLHLEGPDGETMIEPRNAQECRLVVEVPEWADPVAPVIGRPLRGSAGQ